MDLGFLPPDMSFFAISGTKRAGWYGPNGDSNAPLTGIMPSKTRVEQRADPSDLRRQQGVWGANYTHFVDVWVAWRLLQNNFGLDHTISV